MTHKASDVSLSPETAYLDWGFRGFSQSLHAGLYNGTTNEAKATSFYILSNSLFTNPIIKFCIVWAISYIIK
jgi:hypothetical protein